MNGKKFLTLLPKVYESFGQISMSPKSDFVRKFHDTVNVKNSPNLTQLLNTAVDCLEEDEIYCEISAASEFNIVGAFLNHFRVMGYAVCEDEDEQLDEHLGAYDLDNQVYFYEGNYQSFFKDLKDLDSEDKIGIFFYNDRLNLNYQNLLKALMLVRPFLAEEAFIIVSNTDQLEVQEAIADFQSFNEKDQVHYLLNTNSNTYSDKKKVLTFGQEIGILLWQNNPRNLILKKINQKGLIKLDKANKQQQKLLLHVGCGAYRPNALPEEFCTEEWTEIRLDIDPDVQPDIIGTIIDLTAVPDNSVDAVYSSHNLEHIYHYQVPIALKEFKRVLKPNGFAMIRVPDMQKAAEWVVRGEMENPAIYESPAGPIAAIDMFYGLGKFVAEGNEFMAHKTGFTVKNLQTKLLEADFNNLNIVRTFFEIVAVGYK